MKKKLLTERFQQLAGIKPLYTEQSDTDDYGRVFLVKIKELLRGWNQKIQCPQQELKKC